MPRILREIGAQIALIALVLRAFIPVGWMPSSAPGELITFCTHSGAINLFVNSDGQPVKQSPQPNQSNHEVCPFAAAAHLAPPTATVRINLPAALALDGAVKPPSKLVAIRRRFLRQSPRGPPISVGYSNPTARALRAA